MAMEHAIVETDRYHDWSALSHGEWLGLRDSFAAESTLRAVFCQFYASAIGATYYANAYRAQIRSLVSSEVTHTDPRTSLALLEYLQKEYWGATSAEGKELLGNDVIQLPFVLPAIVTRASTIGSLIE